jgi:quercetin 2,3-dioxygenase
VEAEQTDPVLAVKPLGFPWATRDPFLVCVHHDDAYPAGNDRLGPAASLAGRTMGQDFEGKDGWRMYHGQEVPGFPQHPHRGFETVTVVRRGLLDHADSVGAAARYGEGDVQWLTAGKGILHSEMFPLLKSDSPNPLELFQIWLNLPRAKKLVEPHFAMLWSQDIPRKTSTDAAGRSTEIAVVAGRLGELQPLSPPPESWAANAENDVAIWTIKLAPGAEWSLPAARPGTNRTLYYFRGSGLHAGARAIAGNRAVDLRPEIDVLLRNGPEESELLLLQGRPISEPVVQYGPFVMNSREEIHQTVMEYEETQFGGWPWPSDEAVHPREAGRFARHVDGRVEQPKG